MPTSLSSDGMKPSSLHLCAGRVLARVPWRRGGGSFGCSRGSASALPSARPWTHHLLVQRPKPWGGAPPQPLWHSWPAVPTRGSGQGGPVGRSGRRAQHCPSRAPPQEKQERETGLMSVFQEATCVNRAARQGCRPSLSQRATCADLGRGPLAPLPAATGPRAEAVWGPGRPQQATW